MDRLVEVNLLMTCMLKWLEKKTKEKWVMKFSEN